MNEKLMKNSLAGAISTVLAGAATVGTAPLAVANTCPAVGLSKGCNLTITLNANGTATVGNGSSPGNYDGSDDTLVGVINNSGHTVNSIHLSAPLSRIFGFDGDGPSQDTFSISGSSTGYSTNSFSTGHSTNGLGLTGGSGSSGHAYSGTDSTSGTYDLHGPLNSFSNISGNSGDIVFGSSGLANGGSAFFALEERGTSVSFTATTSVPEPGSLGILSAGLLGLAGFGLLRRRQKPR